MTKEEFLAISYECDEGGQHQWLPTSWIISQQSKHVSEVWCCKCYLNIPFASFAKYRKINAD